MTATIRMVRCGTSRTLDGYIFTDREHARQWLSQPYIDIGSIVLEEVEVGPLMACPRCAGSGFRQDVKRIRRLTPEETANYGSRKAPK